MGEAARRKATIAALKTRNTEWLPYGRWALGAINAELSLKFLTHARTVLIYPHHLHLLLRKLPVV